MAVSFTEIKLIERGRAIEEQIAFSCSLQWKAFKIGQKLAVVLRSKATLKVYSSATINSFISKYDRHDL
jgi:hypothetical protein